MLTSPDAAVVRRDPVVPGLRTLLDEDAVAEWLRTALPAADVGGVRARYVRYKPRTSCVVGYDLVVDGREVRGYGKAHRRGDGAKAAKALEWARHPGPTGPGAVVRDGDALAFAFAPNDRRLRRLGDLDPGGRLRRRLAAADPALADADLRWLVHKPERRAVARLDVDGVPVAAVRCHTSGDHARAVAGARTAAAADVTAPVPLARARRAGALLVSWVPGAPLDLAAPDAVPAAAATGAAVARLHRHAPGDLGAVAPTARSSLHAAAAAVAVLVPSVGERAHRLATRLDAHPSAPVATTTVHGDLSADQVVVTERGVALLDFDAAGAGDPADDLGRFLATADAAVIRGLLPAARREAAEAAILDGYAGEGAPVAATRLRRARSAALLALAAEPFRVRDDGWPAHAAALVARAEAFASGRSASASSASGSCASGRSREEVRT